MSRAEDRRKLATARRQANLARAQFNQELRGTKARFSPRHLKDDAVAALHAQATQVKQDLRGAIRRHPVLTGAAIVGLGASLFWKPARSAAIYGMRASQFVWLNRNLWRSIDDKD